MRIGSTLLATASLAALAAPALANDEIQFGPPAEWISDVDVPTDTAEGAEEELAGLPVRVLLTNHQLRLEPGRNHTYVNFVIGIQNPQGLSVGNLSIPWRPEFDELTFHEVLIHRGDEVIDVLGEGQTFTVLRREESLEQATLDGVLTANMFPAGLQVGDQLEVAYSLVSEHPVFAGNAESAIGPYNLPYQNAFARITWPQDFDLHLAGSRGLPEPERSSSDGYEEAQISLLVTEPITPPESAPPRFSLFGVMEASSFGSWQDVASIFVPLYDEASRVPVAGPLRDRVEEIRAASTDPLVRAELALDLVQDDVRYVALAMGSGGLVPADTQTTWQRRYGDCKAKTALLLGVLRELGIEANPIAVNSYIGDSLPGRLPMISAFDHILVQTVIDGKTYFLDGTRTGDTTLASLSTPNFIWGLPIVADGAELVPMVPAALAEPTEEMAIHMDASAGLFAPVPTEIELVLRGDTAIATNAYWAQIVGANREQATESFWREQFDFVTPDEVDARFDPETGTMTFTLSGMARMDWGDNFYETDDMRVGWNADFTRTEGPDSDAPFSLPHPFFERTTQTIILPEGFTAELIDGEEFDEVVANIEYRRTASVEGNVFTSMRSARSIANEFAAADAPAFEQRLGELWAEHLHLKLPDNYRMSEADVEFASSDDGNGEDADFFNDRAHVAMNNQRYETAIADFDRAIALEDDNVWYHANRGMSLAQLNRFDEAIEAFDRADAISADNYVALRGRGLVFLRQGQPYEALDLFNQSLEKDPENSWALFHRATAKFGTTDLEGALEDADAAIALFENYYDAYNLRVAALMALERREEALASAEEMAERFSDNPVAVTRASEYLLMLNEEERSAELLDQSRELGNTPMALYSSAARRGIEETELKLAELDEALELFADYLPALQLRGETLFMEYRLDEAMADAERLIELAPTQPQGYDLKAKILADDDDEEGAAQVAEDLLAAMPDRPDAYFYASNIYRRIGNEERASELLDRQLELAPGNRANIASLMARAQQRPLSDMEGREEDLEAALEIDPDNINALTAMAELQMGFGNFGSALRIYNRLIELGRDQDFMVHNMRGIALERAGRRADAASAFDRARELATDAPRLNNLCWTKTLQNTALERALEECNASLDLQHMSGTLDSRAMTYLRMGELELANADFDAVLAESASAPTSLYGRAIVRAKLGNVAGAQDDADRARELWDIVDGFFGYYNFDVPAEIAP